MNDFKNITGILILPVVAITMIISAPLLLLIAYINYKKQNNEKEGAK